MARPTNDPKTRVLKIRINEEQYEWCKNNGGHSENIRGLLNGLMEKNPEKEKSGCPFDCGELVKACDDMGLDYDIALKRFTQAVYRGKL